jgi:carboxyl-terminal processing protease
LHRQLKEKGKKEKRKMKKYIIALFLLLGMTLSASAQKNKDHHFEVGKHLDIFNQLYKNLELLYVDTLNPKETIGTGINAMLRSLDPYTEYYAQDETKNLRMMLTGKYAGIGALIRKHQKLDRVVIDEPYANMPAAEAGLKKGDVVISIDDTLMNDKTVSYVSDHLRGEPGTSFLLKVMRPSTGKLMSFKITRRNIKLPELPFYGIREGNIGYINLNSFTEGCAKDMRRAFIDLKKQGATSLILDLRGNGGGSEQEAVDILNLWLPKGITVVENRGKVRQANKEYKTRVEPLDTVMPMVVLVNGETASASEITSGAIQDLDRGIILGTRTYGKGLVQIPIDLPYNTNMKVTTSKYYIPSGRCIQAINYKKGSGGYREHIPDSLTKVFYTRNGREVRDGGGIKPDVELKADTIPNIAFYLSASGQDSTEVMFDYVVDYIAKHPTIAPAAEFHLTDADWQEFKERVIQSGFTYDPVSKKQLAELVKTAKFEGYYEEAKPAFDELEKKLNHDVAFALDRYEQVIRQIVEQEIIAAYYYQAGAIEAGLGYDKQLNEAIRLLKTPEEYRKVLAPQKPKETSSLIKLEKKTLSPIAIKEHKMEFFSTIA